ncbi:MAG: phytoene desaturase family protein [Schleiferiaceae bacterium]|nr:phytoene desaturase family protein [Schleiferiaceae bacterium]
MEQSKPLARIIGSGVAGLAVSIRLAQKGYEVHIHEANAYPGGKLSEFRLGAYRFDAGPSLFTLPQHMEDLFLLCGEDPVEHFPYLQKEESCRYFWEDGKRLIAHSDPRAFAEAAQVSLGEPVQNTLAHLALAKKQYEATSGFFLERSLHRLRTYLRPAIFRTLAALPSLGLTQTMDRIHRRRFQSKHMVQLFNRYATFNGSSPYKAPGTLCMIPHLEFGVGTFLPKRGMVDITHSLMALAKRQGVKIHLSEPVQRIHYEGKSASGIELQSGIVLSADLIVSNMDVTPTYRRLLPGLAAPEATLRAERSSSAFIFYWGMDRQFPELNLHNILFSERYEEEFEALFTSKTLLDDPTVYINITSKDVPNDAPSRGENWFVMINAPSDNGQDWDALRTQARAAILSKIQRVLDVDASEHIVEEDYLDPRRIESRTSSDRGALYGSSSNSAMSAFLRHPNHGPLKNLYFCGGSAHPGGGIPLCLLSAKIVGQSVKG